MRRHYEHFKLNDRALLEPFLQAFPFATICCNNPEGCPLTSLAPVIFKSAPQDRLEFHLANENSMTGKLTDGVNIVVNVMGPSNHISPAWYKMRFPGNNPDRSHTAPTYNYMNLMLRGRITRMNVIHLTDHLKDLVEQMEKRTQDRWHFEEINESFREKLQTMITGFVMPIDEFEITAKLSQEQKPEDKPFIIEGLHHRAGYGDQYLASAIEAFDGSTASLMNWLKSL